MSVSAKTEKQEDCLSNIFVVVNAHLKTDHLVLYIRALL